jgi:hypothetical protein
MPVGQSPFRMRSNGNEVCAAVLKIYHKATRLTKISRNTLHMEIANYKVPAAGHWELQACLPKGVTDTGGLMSVGRLEARRKSGNWRPDANRAIFGGQMSVWQSSARMRSIGNEVCAAVLSMRRREGAEKYRRRQY